MCIYILYLVPRTQVNSIIVCRRSFHLFEIRYPCNVYDTPGPFVCYCVLLLLAIINKMTMWPAYTCILSIPPPSVVRPVLIYKVKRDHYYPPSFKDALNIQALASRGACRTKLLLVTVCERSLDLAKGHIRLDIVCR